MQAGFNFTSTFCFAAPHPLPPSPRGEGPGEIMEKTHVGFNVNWHKIAEGTALEGIISRLHPGISPSSSCVQ